jgi:hypothetical protein
MKHGQGMMWITSIRSVEIEARSGWEWHFFVVLPFVIPVETGIHKTFSNTGLPLSR